MGKQIKKYKIKLDSKDKITELLQEIYDEACRNIVEAQNEINRIVNSTNLNEETMDGKAKYAKSVNDFINTKEKAISRKFEIAKLLTEVIKFNGNVQQAFVEGEVPGDWSNFVDDSETQQTANNGPIEYTLR